MRVDVSTREVSDFGPSGLHGRGHAYREGVTGPIVAALRTAIPENPRDATRLSREDPSVGPSRWHWSASRSPNRSLLRLYTDGIRGDPARYLHGVYMEAQRVPSHQVRMHAHALEILLPRAEGPGESGVVLICRPLVGPRIGSRGRQRLGMPITRLELRPA
jgi:hypothetical protein